MKRKSPPLASKLIVFPRSDPAELARFDPESKTCVMNCGRSSDDPRSNKELKFQCDECVDVCASASDSPWIATSAQLPDDETCVLLATDDGEVWTGFHLDGQWFYVSADIVERGVTHWMEFPEPPASVKPAIVGGGDTARLVFTPVTMEEYLDVE